MFVYTVHKYELWIMLMMHWQATDGFFNKLCWSWILLFIRLHWFVRTPIRIVSFQSWCIVFQFFLRHLFVQHLNFSRFWHCDVSYVFEAQSLNKREFNLFIRFFFFITSKAHKKTASTSNRNETSNCNECWWFDDRFIDFLHNH